VAKDSKKATSKKQQASNLIWFWHNTLLPAILQLLFLLQQLS